MRMASPTLPYVEPIPGGQFEFRRVRIVPIHQLIPDPTHTWNEHAAEENDDALTASLKQFGMVTPVIATETASGLLIIDGHRRWTAARRLGWTTVPCQIYPAKSRSEVARLRRHIERSRQIYGQFPTPQPS